MLLKHWHINMERKMGIIRQRYDLQYNFEPKVLKMGQYAQYTRAPCQAHIKGVLPIRPDIIS